MKILNFKKTVSPFSGLSFANYYFNQSGLYQLIDNESRKRIKKIRFQYSEIICNLFNIFLSVGDCIKDIDGNLGEA